MRKSNEKALFPFKIKEKRAVLIKIKGVGIR